MLKLNYFLADIFILSAEKQPIKLSWRKIEWLRKSGKYELCISSLSFTTIFYVLKKICEHDKLMGLLEKLQSLSDVLPVNAEIIQSAIESDFTDFEDAVQYYSATAAGCQVIITRNAKDFTTANIPVYTPAEFLNIQD